MEWFSSCISLLVNIAWICLAILTMVFAFCWWFSLQTLSKGVANVPTIQVHPGYTYMWILNQMYKKKSYNPVTYGHQLVCSFCFAYDKLRITLLWVGFKPWVFFFKPETVEVVLSSNVSIDKSHEYNFLHPWLGTGLLTSTGNKWRSRRKLLTPSFHFRILEDFIPVFNDQSEVLVQKIERLSHEEWVDIVPLITACALEIICQTTMGVTLNAQHDSDTDYVKAIHRMGDELVYRIARPWLLIDQVYFWTSSGRRYLKNLDILHSFTRKVIREKKFLMIQQMRDNADKDAEEKREEDAFVAVKKRKALLEMLLEHHLQDNELTEEDIREEVDTFMFEGHDTTTMAISWALYNIGLLPDVQDKIFRELETIFCEDLNRPVTTDDLKAMKYLECVIKETLRLYPPVPYIARELKQELHVLDYTLPPGIICVIIPFMLHRDSEVFPNPEYFDPDRFSSENSAGRHPYAYIPFSAGPRNCIGQRFALMEEKTLLAQILRKFQVKSLDPRDRILTVPALVLRNNSPLRIKLIPRKNDITPTISTKNSENEMFSFSEDAG